MILTAHQPVYLPWLGLFHKIALADAFVSFNQVQYLPKDWNNRNKIKTANGPIWLTVPVLRSGHREKKLTEIEINNDVPWQRKHWNSIRLNYQSTAYFKKYADYFEDIYTKKQWKYLCDLNDYMLLWFLDQLDINVKFTDARNMNFQGKRNELVLDMCMKMDADIYIFGTLGKNYADVNTFEQNNIKLYFQGYNHPTYPQQYGKFISHLSVLDLLFNHGPVSLDIIMENNRTKDDLLRLVI